MTTDTASREIVAAWQKRHGIDMSIKDATCAFEDAATAHLAQQQGTVMDIRHENTGCDPTDTEPYGAQSLAQQPMAVAEMIVGRYYLTRFGGVYGPLLSDAPFPHKYRILNGGTPDFYDENGKHYSHRQSDLMEIVPQPDTSREKALYEALYEALKSVVIIADQKTDTFDRAKTAILAFEASQKKGA